MSQPVVDTLSLGSIWEISSSVSMVESTIKLIECSLSWSCFRSIHLCQVNFRLDLWCLKHLICVLNKLSLEEGVIWVSHHLFSLDQCSWWGSLSPNSGVSGWVVSIWVVTGLVIKLLRSLGHRGLGWPVWVAVWSVCI